MIWNIKKWNTDKGYNMDKPQKHYAMKETLHVVWNIFFLMSRISKSKETEIREVVVRDWL